MTRNLDHGHRQRLACSTRCGTLISKIGDYDNDFGAAVARSLPEAFRRRRRRRRGCRNGAVPEAAAAEISPSRIAEQPKAKKAAPALCGPRPRKCGRAGPRSGRVRGRALSSHAAPFADSLSPSPDLLPRKREKERDVSGGLTRSKSRRSVRPRPAETGREVAIAHVQALEMLGHRPRRRRPASRLRRQSSRRRRALMVRSLRSPPAAWAKSRITSMGAPISMTASRRCACSAPACCGTRSGRRSSPRSAWP